MHGRARWSVGVLFVLSLTACGGGGGGNSPTQPPPPPTVTGAWDGSFVVVNGPAGTLPIRLQLTQVNNAFTGTWTAQGGGGTLGGVLSGGGIVFDMSGGAVGTCDFSVSGTWTASQIVGTWVRRNCPGTVSGNCTFNRVP